MTLHIAPEEPGYRLAAYIAVPEPPGKRGHARRVRFRTVSAGAGLNHAPAVRMYTVLGPGASDADPNAGAA